MTADRPQALLFTNKSNASDKIRQKLTDAGINFNEVPVDGIKVDDVTGSMEVPVIISSEGDFGLDKVDQFLEIKDTQKKLGIS